MSPTVWRTPLILLLAVGLQLPLLSPLIQWLDSAELTVASLHLGSGHPPGQPLFSLLMYPAHLLPFGSMALRLSLMSMALGVGALLLLGHCLLPRSQQWWLLVFAASQPLMLQTVRQELYALHLALFAGGFWLLQHYVVRPAYQWCLLLALSAGLAAANHTLLALCGPFVMFLIALLRSPKRQLSAVARKMLWAMFFVMVGCAAYLLLPLRATTATPLSFGAPDGLQRLLWVISGRLYESYSHPSGLLFWDNLGSVLALMIAASTPVGFLLALLGWWQRFRSTLRRACEVALLVITGIAAVLPNTLLDVDNPDLAGYLLPAMAIFLLYGWGGVAVFLDQARARWRRGLSVGVTVVMLALAICNYWYSLRALHDYRNPETDRFELALVSTLPIGAHVSLGSYHTYAFLLHLSTVEIMRADLTLSYRGDRSSWGRRALGLAELEPPQYYEFSLLRQADSTYVTREGEERLRAVIPAGWFFLRQASQSPSAWQSLEQQQQAFWDRFFPTTLYLPVGLKQQLTLGHYLHSLYYEVHARSAAAGRERQASGVSQP